MELTNEIYAHEPMEQNVRPQIRKEILETLTLLLAPMTPHLSEELWEMLGHDDGLWKAKWPGFVEEQIELAKDEEVEIPVQVNGRLRGKVKVPLGTGADEVEKLALADPVIAPHLAGKSIVKRIFVPDKLLNLVVA
jgi:leucyl-tRNA synthetase